LQPEVVILNHPIDMKHNILTLFGYLALCCSVMVTGCSSEGSVKNTDESVVEARVIDEPVVVESIVNTPEVQVASENSNLSPAFEQIKWIPFWYVWMSGENLNVDRFRNGDPIPEAKTDEEWRIAGERKQPAWCYYNNDPAYGKKYGKLYNWYAVNDSRGLAPKGHVPSEMEWNELINELKDPDSYGTPYAGLNMKIKDEWAGKHRSWVYPYLNLSDFGGLPGGKRTESGSFSGRGTEGYWWSSTSTESYAMCIKLAYHSPNVNTPNADKSYGLSVRCMLIDDDPWQPEAIP